jgi:DNA-binding NtrC family response regulator
MPGRILVVDDEPSMCEMIETDLRLRDFDVTWRSAPEEALQLLAERRFDVVLTDLKMPGISGVDLCERIVANRPGTPVVVMTAFGSLETAVAAIRAGAYDFVTKPIELDMLALTVERAVNHAALQEQVKLLSEAVERTRVFDELLGQSPPMRELYDQLSRVAGSEVSVLITGESGTGKELVARALHRTSPRRDGPFVPLNCAAIPEALLESELFGHERGAFTGAQTARKGVLMQAHGGTLFLDEIGELPLALQPKLLRALEEKRFRPVGGDREVEFEAAIVAATNRDIETAVEEGRFRMDLYFRVNVIQLVMPPLRSRGTDILLLAQHFLERAATRAGKEVRGISEPAAEKLLGYDWPGNVRELRNAVERAVAMTRFEKIAVEDLPEKVRAYRQSRLVLDSEDPTELVPMEEVERRYILHVLRTVSGNKTLAARVLGLDRKTLYRKLQIYEADGDDR